MLGTLIGISQAARAIRLAGEVTGALAWSGIRVTLITSVYGLLILLVALLLWGGLRVTGRRAASEAAFGRRGQVREVQP